MLGAGCPALGNRSVDVGWHGGVPFCACSWPGKPWAALGGGSVAATAVAASGHMDAAPSCGITTVIFSRDDSDMTCAWWVIVSVRGGCQCAALHHRHQLPLAAAFRGGNANKRICTIAGYEPDMDEHGLRMVMVLRELLMVLLRLAVVRVMAASDGASHERC